MTSPGNRGVEDVVVIGSGASGTIAAHLLAAAGRRVTVLERAPVVAPLLRGFRREGLQCDTGFHYTGGLDQGGFLHRLFDRFGILKRIRPVPLPPDGVDLLRWRGREIAIPVGLPEVEEALARRFPPSRHALRDYFGIVARLLEETPFINPAVPPSSLRRVPEAEGPLAAFLQSRGAEPDLIGLLGRYGQLLYGTDASETPLMINGLVLGSYFRSAHAVVDGGGAIAEAFEQSLEEAGVQIERATEACSVEVGGDGAATGVRSRDGRLFPARSVIYTGHPAALPAMIPAGAVRPAYRKRLEEVRSTPAVCIFYVHCPQQGLPPDRNYYFLETEDDAGRESIVALMAASPTPSGHSPLRAVIEPAAPEDVAASLGSAGPARSPEYARWKEARASSAVRRILALAPGLGSEVSVLGISTPASYRDWTGTAGGSAYGASHTISSLPIAPRTPVGGLYMAGQGILLPGLMGAATSGFVAAGHVAGMDSVWRLSGIG